MTDPDSAGNLIVPVSITIPASWLMAARRQVTSRLPPFRGWPGSSAIPATGLATDAPSARAIEGQSQNQAVSAELSDPAMKPTLVGGQYNPRTVLKEQQLVGKLGKMLFDKYFGPGKQAPAPALRGDPYHPDEVNARAKPQYAPNPAHDPAHPMPNKTLEPGDAERVFDNSVQGGQSGSWFGVNASGQVYRFRDDNAGGAHFAEIVSPDILPPATRRQLGVK